MDSEVKSYVSRFVVPFYFEKTAKGYDSLREYLTNDNLQRKEIDLPNSARWVEEGFWEKEGKEDSHQPEMDLYSYLPQLFMEKKNKEIEQENNIGTSFVLKCDGRLFELGYEYGGETFAILCEHLGVILFKNGIGFLWFETKFRKMPGLDAYVSFVHSFKELSRTRDMLYPKKIWFDREKKEPYYEDFSIGIWIALLLNAEYNGIRFWAERRVSLRDTLVAVYNQSRSEMIEYSKDFVVGSDSIAVPDKAMLFQYVFVEGVDETSQKGLLFHLANGYSRMYVPPRDLDVYSPFGNVHFYFSKGGMSCAVNHTDATNVGFFENQFRARMIRDYFFIFLFLSYQSFSCAQYARLLTYVPAEEMYVGKNLEALESLDSQIHLFLVKSVFETVSHIEHQNGVYRYGKRMLSMEENYQSLTAGLEAMKSIEREKKDRKLDHALIVFGFMVVFSTLIDALNLVDWIGRGITVGMNIWHGAVTIVILGLAAYLVYVLSKNR